MNIKCGDLDIEMERLANGKSRIAVSLSGTRIPGSSTEATDDEVMNLARSLTKLVEERVTT